MNKMVYERKVKIVVYIETGLFIILTIFLISALIFADAIQNWVLEHLEPGQRADVKDSFKIIFIGSAITFGISLLVSLVLLYLLYKGHKERSTGKLKVWFVFGSIGAVILTLIIISAIAKNPRSFTLQIPSIVYVVYRTWTLVAVKGFMNEIRDGQQQPPFQGVQYSS